MSDDSGYSYSEGLVYLDGWLTLEDLEDAIKYMKLMKMSACKLAKDLESTRSATK